VAWYGPRKGPAVDSTVAMSTDCAYSRAAAWRSASSATFITSFSWYTAMAAASAHASSSACLEPTMLRAPVDDQEHLADPLLLLGLHDRLRRCHERCGIVWLLTGEFSCRRIASTTSAYSRKRARASSLSTVHLVLSVGAMTSSGRVGKFWRRREEGFWCPWPGELGLIYRQSTPAGNIGGRTETASRKCWPVRPSKFLAATLARRKFASGIVPPPSGRARRRGGLRQPIGLPSDPSGQASFWCVRP
jgi:hypothetical protein